MRSIYSAHSAGWQCRRDSARGFIWSQLSLFMHLWSAVRQLGAPLSGCGLPADWSRGALAGTTVLCSPWCLILQQAGLGLFLWQKQGSRRKKKFTDLWRAKLRNCTPSLWPLLTKASNEASSGVGQNMRSLSGRSNSSHCKRCESKELFTGASIAVP